MKAEKVFELETGLSAGLLNFNFFIFVFTELPKNAGIHFFLSLILFFLISHWVHTAPQQLRQIIACWAVRALTNPLQMPAWCWSKKLQ